MLLCPWNSPGKNTGVSSHSFLHRIFLIQGSNPGLLHCRQILYCLSHHGSPWKLLIDWFQIGKGICQGCILSPYLFNLYAEYIMWNARLDEAQAGIKIAGRNINNLRYADDTTLMAESKEELKSLLMKVKEESEKVGLTQHSENEDHGIWSHHFTASRWGNNRNSDRLYFGGSKMTATMKLKDTCSLEEKLWTT